MDINFDNFMKLLNRLVAEVEAMIDIIRQDQSLFVENKLERIHINNETKAKRLHEINRLMIDLQPYSAKNHQDHIGSFKDYIQTLKQAEQQKATSLTALLNEKLAIAYNAMTVNNQIISTNLNNFKSFWDKMISVTKKSSSVYEKPKQTK